MPLNAPLINPETVAAFSLKPRFETNAQGVHWIGIKTDKDGTAAEQEPLRLAAPIDLIGSGTDASGSYYRIIRYTDALSRQNRTAALPMAEIGTHAGWQRLQNLGLFVAAGRMKRERLADYLQEQGSRRPYTVCSKAGWTGNAYILPDGEIIREQEETPDYPQIIYNGDKSQAAAYQVSGSLAGWQREIARYAAGNSRLCLALGAALAAPLLRVLDEAGGGFHIYGDSSDGKTTAALVALSVYGLPENLKTAWNGTALGFSNTALARNDGLLVLDEIGEAKREVVSKTAYSVINGSSKIQAAAEGGNRARDKWRIMLFSTGEYTLRAYVERGGEKWEAGQNVRLPSIPAATRYGIYDTLHGFTDGAALSDHLQQAAARYHGTAARAWIRQIIRTDPAQIRAAAAAFTAMLPPLDGQAARVARRFAVCAAALELAAPITGLAAGVGMAGIKQCFDDWHAENGSGKYEDRRILETAAAFMARHAYGARFSDWRAQFTNHDHAGYRKENGTQTEYWINTPVFLTEVLDGIEPRKGCTVLHDARWLQRHKSGGWQHQRTDGSRYYVLIGVEPPKHD